jgi:hypothetical protein
MGGLMSWGSDLIRSESDYRQIFCRMALLVADTDQSDFDKSEAVWLMGHISRYYDTSFQINHEYMPYFKLSWKLSNKNVSTAFSIITSYGVDPDQHRELELVKSAIQLVKKDWENIDSEFQSIITEYFSDSLPEVQSLWKST